jgi:RHS repeat-associated protein
MTNRLATDELQSVVWRWEGEAFGDTEAEELAGFSVNLRFPGQYFDQETNLHYNWNRYYDPNSGRYTTSDPVGLDAGSNTFSYVQENPIVIYDVTGLRGARSPRPKIENVEDLADAIAGMSGFICARRYAREMKRINKEIKDVQDSLSPCDKLHYQVFFKITALGCAYDFNVEFSEEKFPPCLWSMRPRHPHTVSVGGVCLDGIIRGKK